MHHESSAVSSPVIYLSSCNVFLFWFNLCFKFNDHLIFQFVLCYHSHCFKVWVVAACAFNWLIFGLTHYFIHMGTTVKLDSLVQFYGHSFFWWWTCGAWFSVITGHSWGIFLWEKQQFILDFYINPPEEYYLVSILEVSIS